MSNATIRITISGPQGTGKSILARALAGLLNEHGVPTHNSDNPLAADDAFDARELLESVSRMPVEVEITATNVVP